MKDKDILVISQYFYPESFRINDMCIEWVKRGYKVTVLTGIPNYPQGKFFKGYSWFKKRRETWNGIDIIRIPLIPRGHNAIGMIFNYFSFVVSGFFWNIATKVKADYVFTFEVSPMTQALIGKWYARKRKIPCYLYVQDLWPENVEIVTGIHSKLIINPIGKMVNGIYKNCDAIFATSQSFVKEIQKRVFDDKSKVKYLPQYAEEFYRPVEKKVMYEIPDDDSFKIIFAGNIGKAQGLEILPKTAAILKNKSNVKFIIVGDGRNRENFINQIRENSVEDMFIMIDRQPAERIPQFLACCDAAFISFMDNLLFANTIPAKLQSYMACGIPIVASATGETEKIIKESSCGICTPIGDADALADGIYKIICSMDRDNMSHNSKEYYDAHFNKKKLMDMLDDFYC